MSLVIDARMGWNKLLRNLVGKSLHSRDEAIA